MTVECPTPDCTNLVTAFIEESPPICDECWDALLPDD